MAASKSFAAPPHCRMRIAEYSRATCCASPGAPKLEAAAAVAATPNATAACFCCADDSRDAAATVLFGGAVCSGESGDGAAVEVGRSVAPLGPAVDTVELVTDGVVSVGVRVGDVAAVAVADANVVPVAVAVDVDVEDADVVSVSGSNEGVTVPRGRLAVADAVRDRSRRGCVPAPFLSPVPRAASQPALAAGRPDTPRCCCSAVPQRARSECSRWHPFLVARDQEKEKPN